jgi:outer membrane biosynthesis protein TonB
MAAPVALGIRAGKPSNIRVANVSDQAAYKRIIDTVAKWEFSPARKNGQPVTTRVELPLEVKGL